MALVDFAERQLTLKLVYYGPPLSGKTSNLRALHAKVDTLNRGRLMTLDTRDDRTLFFDLLPIFFRTSSFSFRIKVYTVPGQPVHEATRRVVLAGTDGVVFVADSSPDQQDANRDVVAEPRPRTSTRSRSTACRSSSSTTSAISPTACRSTSATSSDSRASSRRRAKTGEGVVATFFALVERAWEPPRARSTARREARYRRANIQETARRARRGRPGARVAPGVQ